MYKNAFILWLLALALPSQAYAHGGDWTLVILMFLLPPLALSVAAIVLTHLRKPKELGCAGWVVVLDEVETLQRVRGDVREKALNALRQLIDEVDAGRFPGLYLLVTGTPAFFLHPAEHLLLQLEHPVMKIGFTMIGRFMLTFFKS